MAKVLIGCRLPNGLVLQHPNPEVAVRVRLNGKFSSKIIGATHGTTEVDADFWEVWKKAYANYQPLKSGAIFEARSETESAAKAKELSKELTGFEPMKQDAAGVKPAEKK
jgi:hypothetical protein